jgi:putative transposase
MKPEMSRTIRTFEATITNQQQVRGDLDQLGWAVIRNRRFLIG